MEICFSPFNTEDCVSFVACMILAGIILEAENTFTYDRLAAKVLGYDLLNFCQQLHFSSQYSGHARWIPILINSHSWFLTKTMVTTFWLAGDDNRPVPHQSSESAWKCLGEIEGEQKAQWFIKHCLIDMPCINREWFTLIGLSLIRGGPDDTWMDAMVFSPEQTSFFFCS